MIRTNCEDFIKMQKCPIPLTHFTSTNFKLRLRCYLFVTFSYFVNLQKLSNVKWTWIMTSEGSCGSNCPKKRNVTLSVCEASIENAFDATDTGSFWTVAKGCNRYSQPFDASHFTEKFLNSGTQQNNCCGLIVSSWDLYQYSVICDWKCNATAATQKKR